MALDPAEALVATRRDRVKARFSGSGRASDPLDGKPSVAHGKSARRPSGELGVVRGHDDGRAVAACKPGEKLDHVGTGPRVEIAGRLVSEDDARADDQSARNGDTLLLAAGHMTWQVRGAVGETDLFE